EVVEVELLFPEAGIHERGGVVLGNEESADALCRVHRELDALGVLLRLRDAGEVDLAHLDRAAVGRDALHLRMRDRQYLVRHDALRLDEALRDRVDLLERRWVVDVSVLRLDDDREDVRAAEHATEIVVDRDVWMALAPRPFVAEEPHGARTGIEV